MAKDEEVQALEEYKEPKEELGLESAKDEAPVILRAVLEEMDLIGPHVKAKDLVGQTFSIYRAGAFDSIGEKGGSAYFCHCVDLKNGEMFTTTLGGQAVVDLLELYFKHGPGSPIQVTLDWVESGAFGGYYTIE